MTREEEIKARMENGYIITTRTYIGLVDTLRADLAEEDVRYLLARNEELQRRVEGLLGVLKSVEWEGGYNIDGKYTCPSCHFPEKHYSQCRLHNALKGHTDA